jgi:hypothetical protein
VGDPEGSDKVGGVCVTNIVCNSGDGQIRFGEQSSCLRHAAFGYPFEHWSSGLAPDDGREVAAGDVDGGGYVGE